VGAIGRISFADPRFVVAARSAAPKLRSGVEGGRLVVPQTLIGGTYGGKWLRNCGPGVCESGEPRAGSPAVNGCPPPTTEIDHQPSTEFPVDSSACRRTSCVAPSARSGG
jgi:hypothetical protein